MPLPLAAAAPLAARDHRHEAAPLAAVSPGCDRPWGRRSCPRAQRGNEVSWLVAGAQPPVALLAAAAWHLLRWWLLAAPALPRRFEADCSSANGVGMRHGSPQSSAVAAATCRLAHWDSLGVAILAHAIRIPQTLPRARIARSLWTGGRQRGALRTPTC